MSSNTIIIHKKKSQGIKKEIINNKLTCSNCGYSLDVSNFYKSKSTATGYRSDCKVCSNRYRKKKKVDSSTLGIIGISLETCAYSSCGKKFATKTTTKAYCSDKCRKRDWYEKNEQHKWKTTYSRKTENNEDE